MSESHNIKKKLKLIIERNILDKKVYKKNYVRSFWAPRPPLNAFM